MKVVNSGFWEEMLKLTKTHLPVMAAALMYGSAHSKQKN